MEKMQAQEEATQLLLFTNTRHKCQTMLIRATNRKIKHKYLYAKQTLHRIQTSKLLPYVIEFN